MVRHLALSGPNDPDEEVDTTANVQDSGRKRCHFDAVYLGVCLSVGPHFPGTVRLHLNHAGTGRHNHYPHVGAHCVDQ